MWLVAKRLIGPDRGSSPPWIPARLDAGGAPRDPHRLVGSQLGRTDRAAPRFQWKLYTHPSAILHVTAEPGAHGRLRVRPRLMPWRLFWSQGLGAVWCEGRRMLDCGLLTLFAKPRDSKTRGKADAKPTAENGPIPSSSEAVVNNPSSTSCLQQRACVLSTGTGRRSLRLLGGLPSRPPSKRPRDSLRSPIRHAIASYRSSLPLPPEGATISPESAAHRSVQAVLGGARSPLRRLPMPQQRASCGGLVPIIFSSPPRRATPRFSREPFAPHR